MAYFATLDPPEQAAAFAGDGSRQAIELLELRPPELGEAPREPVQRAHQVPERPDLGGAGEGAAFLREPGLEDRLRGDDAFGSRAGPEHVPGQALAEGVGVRLQLLRRRKANVAPEVVLEPPRAASRRGSSAMARIILRFDS